MKIGVFDSGIGGLSVANAIEKALPQAEVIFVTDKANFPYATKSPDEIWQGIVPIFQNLIDQQVDVIVVACNTVSTTLGDRLRDEFPGVPIITLNPMVELAATSTKSRIIAVCATPTTLASQHYAELKREFASDITVLEPDCADWSYLIENNEMNEDKIQADIQPLLDAGADTIVLGCTHYHWIESEIDELAAGRAQVIQPESTVVEQVKQVLGLQP